MIAGMNKKSGEEAVSPVVGEMLVLTMVLILAAVFSSSLSGFIPRDRPESVDLAIYDYDYDPSCEGTNLTIWHKGGDPVRLSDIRVIFSNGTVTKIVNFEILDDEHGCSNMPINGDPTIHVLLPGYNVKVDPKEDVSGWSVRIATADAVIFRGKVK